MSIANAEQVLNANELIEDIYPLSPLQQGLLFHNLLSPDSDVYFRQLIFSIDNAVVPEVFSQAWQHVAGRHAIFRTAFFWEGLDNSMQVVRSSVRLPLELRDLRKALPQEQQAALEEYLTTDRKRGFDLSEAPLWRLALLRTSDEQYRFVLSFHHLLVDGWSIMLLLKEVKAYYEALIQGRDLELPPPRPYRDYIHWLEGQDFGGAEVWWRKRLQGFSQVTPLPFADMEANLSQTVEHGMRSLRLSREETAAVQALAQEHHLTMNTVLQAAWGLLLGRHSGERDVVFGTTVSGRKPEIAGVESMVGVFINTLPVRAQWNQDERVIGWLKRLQREQAEAYPFDHTPLVEIHRCSEIGAGASLFESLLVFENYATEAFEERYGDGIKGKWEEANGTQSGKLQVRVVEGLDTVSYPLALVVAPGEELGLRVEYHANRLSGEEVERLLGQLRKILTSMASDPRQKVSEVSWMAEEERQQIVEEWNRTEVGIRERSVQEMFEEQAARTPSAVALECEGQRLTYAELNQRANQLAWRLRKAGVATEDHVGVYLGRNSNLIVSLLAVLKAGGVYVPLDPNYPLERLSFMMHDTSPRVLLTDANLVQSVLVPGTQIINVDEDSEPIAREDSRNLPVKITPRNLAYVVYTSGSTGVPKGVLIEHGGMLNHLSAKISDLTLTAGDVVAETAPSSFDISIWQMLAVLLVGGRVQIIGDEIVKDAAQLLHEMRRTGVTILQTVPTLLQMMVLEDAGEGLPELRWMISNAEALPISLCESWKEKYPNVPLLNAYGPTECSDDISHYRINGMEKDLPYAPLGQPLMNTTMYVLDQDMDPAPVGVRGELYIGGAGVGRGYWKRGGLTAERFVPHPFAKVKGQRLYRTGDVVRQRRDGTLEFIGRTDHQVKIRGYRVELGEIESALLADPGVKQAIVVAREDQPGEKRLVAYVTLQPGNGETDIDRFRQQLQDRLPDYMIPAAFVVLLEFPLSPNGKIDRKALPAPEYGGEGPSRGDSLTAVQEILAGIWKEVLRLEHVSLDDNFFELGGHSLMATQVISRTRASFAIQLPLRTLFETENLKEFTAKVEQARNGKEKKEIPEILPVSREGILPLSFAQQRLWFLHKMDPASAAYNCPVVLRIKGELDRELLTRSIRDIVWRHEMLRTSFPERDGKPVQTIAETPVFQLPVRDLEDLAPEEREKEAERLAIEEANRPFDLGRGPLFRVQLLCLSEREHILLVTMHHIITDAWSGGIFIREFVELYTAHSQARNPQLEPLALQYVDFAAWQRGWLQGEVLEEQLEYWRRQLAGAALLDFPQDYPRFSQSTHQGALMQFAVSSEVLDRLKQLSRQEGVTLFMTLMAAFQLMLARYSEQNDIVVGTPIANRRHRATEALIGFFVNALVVRTDLGGDPTFSELLAQVRQTMLDVYEHQDVPFEQVVDHLMPERNSTRSPFFDVVFVLQNIQPEKFVLPGLELTQPFVSNMPAKVDLSLVVEESQTQLAGLLHYSTELFAPESMRRFLDHYNALLTGIAEDAERDISQFSLLAPAERHELLRDWNDTGRSYPPYTAPVLYRTQVENVGEAVAVSFNGRTLTYEQLDRQTNQLARYLQKLGVGPETRVGIYLNRGLEMALAVMGVLKSGGAYLPLDPAYPTERLIYMAEDAQIRIVLTQASLQETSPFTNIMEICLDSEWGQISEENTAPVASDISPLNAAYVIYTSGSTGKPKGVCLTHEGLCNLALAQQEIFHLGSDNAVLQFASFSFDAATWEISMSLLAGRRLVMGQKEQMLPGPELLQLMRQAGVNAVTLPPSVLAALPEEELPDLHTLVLAGEACGRELVSKWSLGRRMLNAYGPTETTVCATISNELHIRDRQSPSIGRALPNMCAYVLDQELELCPIGIAGELFIGGAGLARGYLNRPELTAEKFVPNPYSRNGGERLYHTGDRARWRANGELEFLGRRDTQVKIRGFRVELEEIEAVLKQHQEIKQAAVTIQERANGDKRIVAYVVLRRPGSNSFSVRQQASDLSIEKPGSLDWVALKKYLHEQLPEYMVPSAIFELQEIPLTSNGKVDRNALREPEQSDVDQKAEALPEERPLTAVEEIIAAIWTDVLGVTRVEADQNFFEIGGHSLLATQVISRIREAFGVDLGLHSLFESPCLRDLAELVEQARTESVSVPAPPLKRVERIEALPLSFAQQRLWFIDQMDPGNPAYNVSFGIRLSGDLNYNAVEQSLSEIVRRHEVLRTTFHVVAGEPRQLIGQAGNSLLQIVDFSGKTQQVQEAEIRQLWRSERNTRFDLSQGPLVRAILVQLGGQQHLLLGTMHHIVSDGWSIAILVREFSKFYEAHCKGHTLDLEEWPIQYADFAVWQRDWLSGELLEEQLGYWRAQLAEAPVLELPTDRPRPAIASHRGRSVTFELSPELTQKLQAISRQNSVTLYMTLLAAYQVLLCRYAGQEDIVVGTPIANRNRAEIEPLIGFFINHIALRCRVPWQWSFQQFLTEVRRVTLGAYAHQDLPFEKLVEELAPERTLSHAPLFQVVFALQNVPYEELHLPGLRLETFAAEREFEKADLSLVMEEKGGVLKGVLGYATDLFEERTVVRMIGHLQRIFEGVCENAEQLIGDLVLLTEEERNHLLQIGNLSGPSAEAVEQCIYEIFEAQVKRTPQAIAVVHEGQTLTYAELNYKANQWARHLASLGIGPELRVGIFLERSLETILAVLATLKAGAAYVALDVEAPMDRLGQLIEEAQISVVMTQERLRHKLPAMWPQVVGMDQDWETVAQLSGENLEVHVSSNSLAYVIYTSGSTGKPKGVGIEHRQICSYVRAVVNRLQLQEAWNYGLISTFAADLGNTMLFPSLCVGGILHVIDENRGRDGNALKAYVQQHGELDCLKITPTQLRLLTETGGVSVLPTRRLVVGGEASLWEWMQEWQVLRPECQIWNHYGPTECTVGVCTYDVTSAISAVPPACGNVPLGVPLEHSQLYVLDASGQLAPVGVPGELYIGGEGVGRGYLNTGSATADRFVPDPFTGKGGRLYRTGDRVTWSANGNLEFLGRTDKQIKLRGYRVELGEIESVLNEHPAVRQGAVVLREDAPDQRRLVAYVVPHSRKPRTVGEEASYYRLPNGIRVAQQNKNETEYLYREIFENQVYFRYGIELAEDACVFDIGANIGMFTLFTGERCPRGRIYAFEPISGIFECLKANAGLLGNQQVKVFCLGLSNEENRADFTYYSRYSMMSGLRSYSDSEQELETIRQTLRNQREGGDAEAVELLANIEGLLAGRFDSSIESCQLRRLSDIVREEKVQCIDVLKVDAQRAELDVLLGIDDEDWGKIRQIVMEVHDGVGQKTEGRLQEILSLLESKGFYAKAEQYDELRGTDRWNLYASRKELEERACGLPPAPLTSAPGNAEAVEVNSVELRKYLAGRLPEYMVPSAIVLLDELPRNPNGKLDYKALPRPEACEALQNYREPKSPIEEILAGIWAEVLKIDRVGTDQNFFELGGHSLLATQVISRAQAAFGVELSLRFLFEEPTILGFAAYVEQALQKEPVMQLPPIMPVSRELPLPLSFAQQRLWFLQQLDEKSAVYNLPYALRLIGPMDQAALEYALTEIIRRHEILRTRYELVNGEAVQRTTPPAPAPIEYIDLRDATQPEDEARALLEKEVAKPFDLHTGPVFRIRSLRMADDDHVILLTLHHIASDGWSLALLVREFVAFYRAAVSGGESGLKDLLVQYADFAVWQRQVLTENVLQSQLQWWRSRLGDLPILNLPLDRPRPAVKSYRGDLVACSIPQSLVGNFEAFCRQEGTTTFMGLLAVFQILLGRYAGQTDVVVGTEIAGRNRLDIESLIGFFVNQLPLRLDFSDGPKFVEALARVRETTLGAYAHQDLPFEKLVDELGVERDLSFSPVFQTKFVMQNLPRSEMEIPGLRCLPFAVPHRFSQFDLTMSVEPEERGLRMTLEYATDLFNRSTAEQMVRRFITLLEGIVAEPGRGVMEIPLLTQSERQGLLQAGTGIERPGPFKGFQEIFEAQVQLTPDAVAISDHTRQLTYRELNERANQLACYLLARGAHRETTVGLCLDRGVDVAVGLIGILKSGAAWLPLNASYPPDRLAFTLKDAKASLLVTQERICSLALFDNDKTICLDSDWETIAGEENLNLPVALPSQLAYVIYTSGSTGQPKGVMIEHQGMVNHLLAKIEDLEITHSDVIAQNAVLSFDISIWQILAGLMVGAQICVIGDDLAHDGSQLLEEVEKREITVFETVPALLAVMLERQELAGAARLKLENLRVVVSNAEALPSELALRWMRCYPAIPLKNTYGATECSDDVTHYDLSEMLNSTLPYAPLGRLLRNLRLYVLDEQGEPVPPVVAGEVYIGGVGVGRGYLNQPALTASSFLPDPFGTRAGERLYRTGDLARWRSDGTLEFVQRMDQQVKVRGYRIELGEIEAALCAHPGVKQAVVLTRQDGNGGNQLVAYAVPANGHWEEVYTAPEASKVDAGINQPVSAFQDEDFATQLREFLKEKLPEYMSPSALLILEKIPLTANGKPDRSALPVPEFHGSSDHPCEEPLTPAERVLAGIWQQVLRVEKVGRQDNFFQLGGDSILSIKVVSRAKLSGLHISLQDIFQQQTLAELASVARTEQSARVSPTLVRGSVPLTPIQHWFFEQELEQKQHFNQALMLTVKKGIKGEQVRRGVEAVLEHHDGVRLRFRRREGGEGGGWEQWYGERSEGGVEEVDLRGLEEEKQREAMREKAEEMQRGMDLEKGPVARGAYFELGEEKGGRLLLVLHHLIVDGVSWRILVEDIQVALQQMEAAGEVVLLEKGMSWQEWAEGLKEWVEGGGLEREEGEYWLGVGRRDSEGEGLPRDYEGGENVIGRSEWVERELGEEETGILVREGGRLGVQMQEMLLTGLAGAVVGWSGGGGVLVDLEGHGREGVVEGADVTRTVGWFTTHYPVWLAWREGAGVEEQMRAVKEEVRRVPRHGIGYGLLRYMGNEEMRRGLAEQRGAEIIFNYMGQLDESMPGEALLGWAEERSGETQDGRQRRGYVLEVTAGVKGGRLQVGWRYGRELHQRETVEKVAERFMDILHSIARLCNNVETSVKTRAGKTVLSQQDMQKLLSSVSVHRVSGGKK